MPITLNGVLAGGGVQDGRERMLGVFLSHDPSDFGLHDIVRPSRIPAKPPELRTGLSDAIATDAGDDTYDLSWLQELSPDAIHALKRLRLLLVDERDPIDRHFMFAEIEWRLYRARDSFASALDEYDELVGSTTPRWRRFAPRCSRSSDPCLCSRPTSRP